jgi:hypothetical protein
MWRLIFCENGTHYQTIDSNNSIEIIAAEGILRRKHITVLCVVDYTERLIFSKSKNFENHREFIDEIIFDPKLVEQY